LATERPLFLPETLVCFSKLSDLPPGLFLVRLLFSELREGFLLFNLERIVILVKGCLQFLEVLLDRIIAEALDQQFENLLKDALMLWLHFPEALKLA